MSMSPERIDEINGPGSYDKLLAAREANKRPVTPEDIVFNLSKVGLNGVVKPEDSRMIHTGEVPAITNEERTIEVRDEGSAQEVEVRHER